MSTSSVTFKSSDCSWSDTWKNLKSLSIAKLLGLTGAAGGLVMFYDALYDTASPKDKPVDIKVKWIVLLSLSILSFVIGLVLPAIWKCSTKTSYFLLIFGLIGVVYAVWMKLKLDNPGTTNGLKMGIAVALMAIGGFIAII